jgi:hypothetical protein
MMRIQAGSRLGSLIVKMKLAGMMTDKQLHGSSDNCATLRR